MALWTYLFGTRRKLSHVITIVSGLPRSGTSLMMRMLEAGGMAVVVDHIRPPDTDNPYGYYEFEPVKNIKADASFLDRIHGKACKMVSMLLYDLPSNRSYYIIFMQRHLTEVLASQSMMLQRHGQPSRVDDDATMLRMFHTHLSEITAWLARQPNMDVLYVNYNDLMQRPLAIAATVNQFLGGGLNVHKMAAVVDQRLYRNRALD
jgi:hypothetical protein